MSSHKESSDFHIVVSVLELQSIDEMEQYLNDQLTLNKYIITVESGQTGHQHLDCYVQFTKPKRQDKFRAHLIKSLYDHLPKEQHRNIKVTVNYIDSNPLYAIGYSLKEDPKVVRTNYSVKDLSAGKDYYLANQEKVTKLKAEISNSHKNQSITVDSVAQAYLNFCISSGFTSMYYTTPQPGYLSNKNIHHELSWKTFRPTLKQSIPFSIYQKINQDKIIDWVDDELLQHYANKGGVS